MKNPRTPGDKTPISKFGEELIPVDDMVRLMNDFCDLGGTQLNITGGEPLARRDIVSILKRINKKKTRVVLNSNVMLADRLLKEEHVHTVDAIYASLHTTSDTDFKNFLGIGGGAHVVMKNMVLLKKHGYNVQINYSLGDYNKNEFENVLAFAQDNRIHLKAITLIRSTEKKEQYGTDRKWVNPNWLDQALTERALIKQSSKEGFGGYITTYKTKLEDDHEVVIKNVGTGRLVTDFCQACPQSSKCGEGIYALRVGVDGIWKPCLLNNNRYEPIQETSDFKLQILAVIHKMVGNWENHRFAEGSPQ